MYEKVVSCELQTAEGSAEVHYSPQPYSEGLMGLTIH